MALKTEGAFAAECILQEAAGDKSRETVTVLSGQNLGKNAVVGMVALGIGRVSIPTVVTGGSTNGTATLVYAGPDVEQGNYVLECITAVTNGGVFTLTAPSGKRLPNMTLTPGAGGTTIYQSSHINFTITDGSANFLVGDKFTFVVDTTAPTVIGGTGDGVMTALSLGPDAKPGRYQVFNRVVIANGGDFEVIGPDGDTIGRFNWAASGSTAAFTSRQVNFTLSDGTDFVAGNYFDICVFNIGERGKGKMVVCDPTPTAYDGRHRVAGILLDAVDATSADKKGLALVRDAVVKSSLLTWDATVSAAEQEVLKAGMARNLGIVAR